jgi:ArsR family transcriptional regulator
MARKLLKEETLSLVAERFRLLGDPLRLQLLQTLGRGEMSVAQIVETTSTTQANVSKHLQLLLRAGLVKRRKEGLHSFYSIADPSVFQLCDLVCGSLSSHLVDQLSALEMASAGAGAPAAAPPHDTANPRSGKPRSGRSPAKR